MPESPKSRATVDGDVCVRTEVNLEPLEIYSEHSSAPRIPALPDLLASRLVPPFSWSGYGATVNCDEAISLRVDVRIPPYPRTRPPWPDFGTAPHRRGRPRHGRTLANSGEFGYVVSDSHATDPSIFLIALREPNPARFALFFCNRVDQREDQRATCEATSASAGHRRALVSVKHPPPAV